MKAQVLASTVGSLPVGGVYASLDTADAVALLNTATGLARQVAWAGALGLGVALLVSSLAQQRFERNNRVPLGSFARVQALGDTFFGVCLTPTLEIELSDGQRQAIPMDCILSLSQGFSSRYIDTVIDLIDGSKFRLHEHGSPEVRLGRVLTESLSFLTLAGQRGVTFARWDVSTFLWMSFYTPRYGSHLDQVKGVLPQELEGVRTGLRNALNNNAQQIQQVLGPQAAALYLPP